MWQFKPNLNFVRKRPQGSPGRADGVRPSGEGRAVVGGTRLFRHEVNESKRKRGTLPE